MHTLRLLCFRLSMNRIESLPLTLHCCQAQSYRIGLRCIVAKLNLVESVFAALSNLSSLYQIKTNKIQAALAHERKTMVNLVWTPPFVSNEILAMMSVRIFSAKASPTPCRHNLARSTREERLENHRHLLRNSDAIILHLNHRMHLYILRRKSICLGNTWRHCWEKFYKAVLSRYALACIQKSPSVKSVKSTRSVVCAISERKSWDWCCSCSNGERSSSWCERNSRCLISCERRWLSGGNSLQWLDIFLLAPLLHQCNCILPGSPSTGCWVRVTLHWQMISPIWTPLRYAPASRWENGQAHPVRLCCRFPSASHLYCFLHSLQMTQNMFPTARGFDLNRSFPIRIMMARLIRSRIEERYSVCTWIL